MIHQYKLGGYNIVLDVCSGAVHAVDEVAYDIISLFENEKREKVIDKVKEIEKPYIREHSLSEAKRKALYFSGADDSGNYRYRGKSASHCRFDRGLPCGVFEIQYPCRCKI